MSKKTKLKELKQIDAKAEPPKPMTLDQLWGERGLTKYNTDNIEDIDNIDTENNDYKQLINILN